MGINNQLDSGFEGDSNFNVARQRTFEVSETHPFLGL